jgi:hypothetical protein
MPRLPSRLLVPTLALIALLFLSPTLVTALPQGGATIHSAAERPEVAPGFLSKLWDLLSGIGATGSSLEPNGASSVPETESNADTGDNGSGLDPDG